MVHEVAHIGDAAVSVLSSGPVIPVVVIHQPDRAVPLVRALARGGVRVAEITLRTPAALEAIERVAAEVPEVTVGAGSVTTPDQVAAVQRAGARFLVLPGSPRPLFQAARDTGLPVLPGVSTVTEVMGLMESGQEAFKFFPAEASGGIRFLEAVAGPLPGVHFCPTGGVTPHNAREYLLLPNVACVGGSWLTPREAVEREDWDRIESLAADAATLGSGKG